MRVTIKQLQDTIKAKDRIIKYYQNWMRYLGKHISRIDRQKRRKAARIEVLGKALAALEKDYKALKRKKK